MGVSIQQPLADKKITFEDEVQKRFGIKIESIQFFDINFYSDNSGRTYSTVEFDFIVKEK